MVPTSRICVLNATKVVNSSFPLYELWDHKGILHRSSSSPICGRGALALSQLPVSDTFDSMRQPLHIGAVQCSRIHWSTTIFTCYFGYIWFYLHFGECYVVEYIGAKLFSHASFWYIWFYEQWAYISCVHFWEVQGCFYMNKVSGELNYVHLKYMPHSTYMIGALEIYATLCIYDRCSTR